jgi:hypothetical protein
MKPRTKLQMEVWKLHQKLSDPVEHEPFVISKHDLFYTTHYKNLVCLECNHSWKLETEIRKEKVARVVCPSCKKKLKKIVFNNGKASRFFTYSVAQVVDRFQVIRYFSCWKHLSKTKNPQYHFRSLFEEWKDWDKNKRIIIGRTQSWSGDGFSSSEYEVRNPNGGGWRNSEFDKFASDFNCPDAEFLPRFEKYDLKKYFHNCDYRFLLNKLERSSEVETLFKAKQKELLFYAVHKDERYSTYWPQIKIVMRHKYKITDAGIWYDYLELLREFEKDIRNPKFILPKNLKNAHNEYVAKKQARIERERAERELRRQVNERHLAEAEEALKNIKAEVFKDFSFKQGKIKIVALVDEEEVKKEGIVLKHCVHTNGYHKKSGILLMSARINGRRIETIEISLASYSIIQSRGFDNGPTEFHDEIIGIVRKNMGKISRLVEKQKKFQELDSKLSRIEKDAAA